MSVFIITVQATITETYIVEADDMDAAIKQANKGFAADYKNGTPEKYNQETISARLVEA